jgi:hypothetical protein
VKSRRPPGLAIALLERCLPDNNPLTGDLLEAWSERSNAWLRRQVLLAVFGRLVLRVRANPRASTEEVLVATAMLALLGYYAVVAAGLMNHVLFLHDPQWAAATGRYQAWRWYAAVPLFGVALLIGRAIGRFHHNHRIAAVLAYGASTTAVTFLNLYLFVPDAPLPPSAAHAVSQIAIAMVFLVGLFVEIGSRSGCETLPSA